MLEKVLFLVLDGLGDRPIKELGGATPLEAAHTPHLDRLAQQGECGMLHTIGRGIRPGSDTAHLTIFGYDKDEFYAGRGPIEAAGIGLELCDGDVALRCNLATVDDDLMILDRRAGRIHAVTPFTTALDGIEIDQVRFLLKPGTAHRAILVMRGPGLSSAITDNDPHEEGVPVRTVMPTDDSPGAKKTADLLNQYVSRAYPILRDHPENQVRGQAGKLPANYLLLRGPGRYRRIPSFQERYGLRACCVAGGGLYKGIAALLGMEVVDVPGATGLPDTDVSGKFRTAVQSLADCDFVFVHVKAADSLGEDGDFVGKRSFIEKVDAAAAAFRDLPDNVLLVILADHTTPCELRAHSADPVPILVHGSGVRVDAVSAYSERACTSGGLGFLTGIDVIPQILNLLGRTPLTGG
ncbi:MAG: 2,3-bisphosphoglycerate-independent phosphoglycerate mutase [Phycisphaerales bacterium]|nr:MAG: 2,3-bisphosphoglycerate-independent phosphoglycerate mutase [Phycisphaerales bacterium]